MNYKTAYFRIKSKYDSLKSKEKKVSNPAVLIREELLNFELEMARASAIKERSEATLDWFNGLPDADKKYKANKKKAVIAELDYAQYKTYLNSITKSYLDLKKEVDGILGKYEPKYKEIFEMAFIQRGNTEADICEKTDYDIRTVRRILKTLSDELANIKKEQRYGR